MIANTLSESELFEFSEDRMNGSGCAVDLKTLLVVCMALMTFFAYPGITFNLWKTLNGVWITYRSKKVMRRKKLTGEKLKKYCEIDMRRPR